MLFLKAYKFRLSPQNKLWSFCLPQNTAGTITGSKRGTGLCHCYKMCNFQYPWRHLGSKGSVHNQEGAWSPVFWSGNEGFPKEQQCTASTIIGSRSWRLALAPSSIQGCRAGSRGDSVTLCPRVSLLLPPRASVSRAPETRAAAAFSPAGNPVAGLILSFLFTNVIGWVFLTFFIFVSFFGDRQTFGMSLLNRKFTKN